MNLACQCCGTVISVDKRGQHLLHPDEPFLCDIRCFLRELFALPRRDIPRPRGAWRHNDFYDRSYNWIYRSPFDRSDADVWSEKLNQFFHSKWEVAFAEFAVGLGLITLYEPIFFHIGSTIIIPDFYFPEYDAFVELKGAWHSGAKDKWTSFRTLYPKVKVFLLPWHLRSGVRKGRCV